MVSTVAYLVCAEKKPLKERLYKCKLSPLIKHHSIFDAFVPSIIPSLPIVSTVPNEYTVDTTLGIGSVPAAEPALPQPEVQLPLQSEVQYSPEPEVQSPTVAPSVPQPEEQPPAQQQVAQEQPLYPPQHEGQHAAAQQQVSQNPPPQNEGLYPPQHNAQYYPAQNEGQYYTQQNNGQYYPAQNPVQYYPVQNQGLYYQPPNYIGTNNVPYNYPVYGQNVLRSVKALDAQINHSPNGYMLVQKPYPYKYIPRAYAAPFYYNYVPRAPKTPQALIKVNEKST